MLEQYVNLVFSRFPNCYLCMVILILSCSRVFSYRSTGSSFAFGQITFTKSQDTNVPELIQKGKSDLEYNSYYYMCGILWLISIISTKIAVIYYHKNNINGRF